MANIKENTHIVIKRDDAIKYLSEKQKHDLDSILLTINIRREKEGKPINNYLVINKDEPYAKIIQDIIINSEHDSDLLDKVAEKLKARHYYMETEEGWGGYTVTDKDIDEVIAELKAEVEE